MNDDNSDKLLTLMIVCTAVIEWTLVAVLIVELLDLWGSI